MTPIRLGNEIFDFCSKNYERLEISKSKKFKPEDNAYVIDWSIKDMNSKDGAQYFLVGKLNMVRDTWGSDLSDVYMSKIIFAYDCESAGLSKDLSKTKNGILWTASSNSIYIVYNIYKFFNKFSRELIRMLL
jgi:hypothetical protein